MKELGLGFLLAIDLLLWLPSPTYLQTDGAAVNTANLIDYNVALYVLIGIAVVYSLITLLCFVLVICSCMRTRRRESGIQYEKQLDAQSSCPSRQLSGEDKVNLDIKPLIAATNTLSLLDNGQPSVDQSGTKNARKTLDTSFMVANESALEAMHDEEDSPANLETQLEHFRDRNDAINKSFSRVLMINVVRSSGERLESSDYAQYTPQGLHKVYVPYSEPELRTPDGTSAQVERPHRSRVDSTDPGPSRQSPFNSLKKPKKEVPSVSESRHLSVGESPTKKFQLGLSSASAAQTRWSTDSPPSRRSPFLGIRNRVAGSGISPIAQNTLQSPAVAQTLSLSSKSNFVVSEPDTKTLMEALNPVRHKWYAIGLKLNYSEDELSIIMNEHTSVRRRLCGICERWTSRKDANWQNVVEILRLIGEHDLAKLLDEKYCLESVSRTYL